LGYSYWRRPLHSDVNICTKHSTKLVHNCPFCGEHFSVDNHGLSIEQFIQALDSYIRWYNEKRIKISLGALSPIEYRESLGLAA